MILYIDNPKDATKKLLELINEFGKVAFLYINNEVLERKIKETIPFMIAPKQQTYLRR